MCPVARTGSIENLPDGSSSLMLKMELMPVSVSLISMSRLARGVPMGEFSRMVTLYSGLLKVGVSSLTSLMVMVMSAVELVSAAVPTKVMNEGWMNDVLNFKYAPNIPFKKDMILYKRGKGLVFELDVI